MDYHFFYLQGLPLDPFDWISVHLDFFKATGIGLGGWLAIRRWQAEQARQNWNSQKEPMISKLNSNLLIYHTLFLQMSEVHGVMKNKQLNGERRKEIIERISKSLHDALPEVMLMSYEIEVLIRMGFENVSIDLANMMMRCRYSAYSFFSIIKDLSKQGVEYFQKSEPNKECERMFDEAKELGIELNRIQRLIAEINVAYEDWLVEMRIFGSMNTYAFTKTDAWKAIKNSYDTRKKEKN